ncbi:hypothetical protein HanXRQr2_Chr11g0481191 [Helianthus annuus]|uniref:Uncharacterized protein n=1 Tax=Helianthus annuus TaxID=4232 RepID=A0A9K3HMM6_HELAN|nr:hypothetical protein HanXRQr2_Chr11g0481181 [Helianthus annuus]KAF5781243.1 hypothetical protein HanXRQr2_Chr11g0481191 [Helianthus annuus]
MMKDDAVDVRFVQLQFGCTSACSGHGSGQLDQIPFRSTRFTRSRLGSVQVRLRFESE